MDLINSGDLWRRQSLLESHVGFKIEALLLQALKARDSYTQAHSSRVVQFAERIGRELGFSNHDMDVLSLSAGFHDIGKIGIPDHILLKPAKLSTEEREVIQTHPRIGANILRSLSNELMDQVAQCVLCHHEHWDGTGYPNGLVGEQIPLVSRVIAVVDALDAMTSRRSYRDSMEQEQTMQIILSARETQFCPQVVDVLSTLAMDGTFFHPDP